MLRMAYIILKANAKRKRQDRRDRQIAALCEQKLDYLKKRRIFRAIIIFTKW